MARPKGALNADHAETRQILLGRVRRRLLAPGGARASFRELAAAAEVSPATLRHYFPDREALVAATFEALKNEGAPFMAMAASAPRGPVREALPWFIEGLLVAWRQAGVGHAHELGLTAGLGDPDLGPAYVTHLLEPTLQTAEARLALHVASGELAVTDTREAALVLVSPIVLALLHQEGLAGVKCRPLDVEAFARGHTERFIAMHAAPARA